MSLPSQPFFGGKQLGMFLEETLSFPSTGFAKQARTKPRVTGGEVKERIWISSISIDEDVWFVALLIGRSPMSLKLLPIPVLATSNIRS
jgi:hypothetical protein